jgi:L-ascorbate metabolism protein UlaG (beta-lactamase superfamily)
MRATTLGWAGLQLEADGFRLAIDPFADPGPFDAFMTGPSTELRPPEGPVDAVLLTHLHRDHADPVTLGAVLADGAPVLCPRSADGAGHEGVAAVEAELAASGLELLRVAPGDTTTLGPFTVTAVEAVDGLGDPQVSWCVATDRARIFHGGDTVWHGAWWRIARAHGPFDAAFLPANGANVAFPWMSPAADVPATLTPEQAVAAARALGAGELVAIHHGVLEHETYYRPHPDVPGAVAAAAARHGYPARAAVAGDELRW